MMRMSAGRPFVDLVKACYSADLPVMVMGPAGVGKSHLLVQAATTLGIEHRVCDLSVLEAPDLIGLPWRDNERTRYATPSFLPFLGKGLLILEELNRAAAQVRAPALQLLTARRLNEYHLPKGWLPVAAINPPQDDYEVF